MRPWKTVIAAFFVLSVAAAAAGQDAMGRPDLKLALDVRFFTEVRTPRFKMQPPWWAAGAAKDVRLPRYPFMADPRGWPKLFANTTECTLSLNPITRRHRWQG